MSLNNIPYLSEPSYIFNSDELDSYSSYKDKTDFNFNYITNKDELNILVSAVCSELKHPTTIIDINNPNTISSVKREDSQTYFLPLRTSCELFRKTATSNYCKICDAYHANLFKGATLDNITDILSNNIKKIRNPPNNNETSFFVDSYYNNKPNICSHNNKAYISYYCPMLGYIELVFPIFFNNNVIGTLFVGQFLLKDDNNNHVQFVTERKKEFFKKNPLLFDEYCKIYKEKTNKTLSSKEIQDLIITADYNYFQYEHIKNYFHEPAGIINEQTSIINNKCNDLTINEKILDNIVQMVSTIEDYLHRLFMEKKENFFHTSTLNIIDKHIDNYTCNFPVKNSDIALLWTCIYKIITEISTQFHFENFAIFANHNPIANENSYIKNCIYSTQTSMLKNYRYNFKSINSLMDLATLLPICSLEVEDLFNGFINNKELTEDINEDDMVILAYSDILFVFQVNNLKNNINTYKTLFSALSKNLTKIYSLYRNITLHFLKEHHEATLRLYKHECSHLANRMQENNYKYFNKFSEYSLDSSKANDVFEDMKSTILLINNLANNIGIILGNKQNINRTEQEFRIFKDLIYKWESMFGLKLQDKLLNIISPFVSINDSERPFLLNTDKELFELLLYNIMDNAVKYSYVGSNIYIDCKKPFINSSSYILSIINYGSSIPTSQLPYELYWRENDNTNNGDGIGLYSCKEIARILDININHYCNKISDFNLPLIVPYLQNNAPDDLYKAINRSYHDIIKNNRDIIEDHIYKSNIIFSKKGKKYLSSEILKPTYEVKFEIDITNIVEV